jgi:hypothetical protein
LAYISQFFSGGVDPSVPHCVLILLTVVGGVAVGGGIIWEAAKGGHLWTLPTLVVFFGVVIEATATVILFEASAGSESTAKPAARAKVKRMDLFPLAGRSACCGECCSGKAAALYRQHRRHAQRLGLRGAGHRARGSAGRIGPVHVGVAVDIRDPDLRRLLRRDRPGIR